MILKLLFCCLQNAQVWTINYYDVVTIIVWWTERDMYKTKKLHDNWGKFSNILYTREVVQKTSVHIYCYMSEVMVINHS